MKVDLVYLWVDDTDYDWKKKIAKYKNNEEFFEPQDYDPDAVDICRFYNNDELKYSLRSVEKYAPWINKIFIVTDNQIPDWLNISNPKIKIVDHSEIIPGENLPLFNSCAIEGRIPYIKDLSEYFLYANDDTFFWDNVDEKFFFQGDKPICRFADEIPKWKTCKHLYGKTIQRAYGIVNQKYKLNVPLCFPHHNIDAYRKSLFLECIREFEDDFNRNLLHKFRKDTDMQRVAVSYYMIAKNAGVFKSIKINWWQKYFQNIHADSRNYGISGSAHHKYKTCRASLVCLNDGRSTKNKDRELVRKFLDKKFPEKSFFEI